MKKFKGKYFKITGKIFGDEYFYCYDENKIYIYCIKVSPGEKATLPIISISDEKCLKRTMELFKTKSLTKGEFIQLYDEMKTKFDDKIWREKLKK